MLVSLPLCLDHGVPCNSTLHGTPWSWCMLAVENELKRWGAAFAFVSSELSGNDQSVKILILVLHFLHLTTVHFPTPQCCNAGKVSLISLLLPSPPHQQRQRLGNLHLAARLSSYGSRCCSRLLSQTTATHHPPRSHLATSPATSTITSRDRAGRPHNNSL